MSHDVANGSRALSVWRRLVVRSLRSHRRLARALATGAGLGAAMLASPGYTQQYAMPRPGMPAQAPHAGMMPYSAPAPAWRLVPVQVDAQGGARPVTYATPINGPATYPWCPPPAVQTPLPGKAPAAASDAAQPLEGQAASPEQPEADAARDTTDSGADAPSTQPADVTSQSAADQSAFDASLSSATGGAESASSGAPNMVGDFIFPGGQIAYTPPARLETRTVNVLFPGLRFQPFPTGAGNYPNDQFFDPNNTNTAFMVQPPGLLPGQPGPQIDQWHVLGGPLSGVPGQPGTATLTGIDPLTGAYVATVSVPQVQQELVYPPTIFIDSSALALNRFKVTENNHPLPNDRVFFNYNWYQNPLQTSGSAGGRSGMDIHQFTFGVERTVLHGWGSVELRVPFSSTINSTQFLDHSNDAENVELGDVRLIVKALLYNDGQVAAAVGAAVSTPTSDDLLIYENARDTNPVLTLRTEAVHVIPFVTVLARPYCSRFSAQAWAQVDFDASGNEIEVRQGGNVASGELRDQTLLYMDGAVSYDFWDSGCYPGRCGLTRIVPAAELHWTSTLEDAEFFHQGNVVVGNFHNQLNILNGTLAAHFLFGSHGQISPAYVLPLSDGKNKVMDGEFALQTQWNY